MPVPRNEITERLAPAFAISSPSIAWRSTRGLQPNCSFMQSAFFCHSIWSHQPGPIAPTTHFARNPLALPQGGIPPVCEFRIRKEVCQAIGFACCCEEYGLAGWACGQEKARNHYILRLMNTRTTRNSRTHASTFWGFSAHRFSPRVFHMESTRDFVPASITISSGQGRRNPSLSHLRVASIPIFEP